MDRLPTLFLIDYVDTLKAGYLFKQNLDALLKGRGQTRHDLAVWCRRSDAWLSKILGRDDRNLPLKYLDRIADFFGIAAYELFRPGISPLTERRRSTDRRSGQDRRRVSRAGAMAGVLAADLALDAEDVAFLLRWKSLGKQARADIAKTTERAHRARAGGTAPAAHASSPATPPATAARRR